MRKSASVIFVLALMVAFAVALYFAFSDDIADEDMATSSGSSLRAIDGKWHVAGLMDGEEVFVLLTDIDSTTTRGQQGSYNSNTRGVGGSGELIDDVSGKTLLTWKWNVRDDILIVNDEPFVLSQNRALDVAGQD